MKDLASCMSKDFSFCTLRFWTFMLRGKNLSFFFNVHWQTSKDLEEAEKQRKAQKRAILDLRSQNASRLVYELLSDEIPLPPDSPIDLNDAPPRRQTSASKKTTGAKQSAAKTWTDRADQATALYRDIFDNYSKFLYDIDNSGDEEAAGQTAAQSARPMKQGSTYRPMTGNGGHGGAPPIGGSARERRQRPFSDLVRVQRPEMLQRNREHVRQLMTLRASQPMRSSSKKSGMPDTRSKPNAKGWFPSLFTLFLLSCWCK